MKVGYTFIVFLSLVSSFSPLKAEVFVSDHFDSHTDWVGHNGSHCVDPPLPWSNSGYFCSRNISINSKGAHGKSGKGLCIEWTPAMAEYALMARVSDVGARSEFWIGFWHKHNRGWDWGKDVTHKWYYGPQAGGDRMMINYDQLHRAFWNGRTQLQSNIPFDAEDNTWHSWIIYLKHNTRGNKDGSLRMWRDGKEVLWTVPTGGQFTSNTELRFAAKQSTFDASFQAFGFQSRPDWGTGNTSFFDDIIIASTASEVQSFLGVAMGRKVPSPPTTNGKKWRHGG